MCMPIRIEEEKPFRPDALAVFEQASDKPGPQIGQALEDLVGMVEADIGDHLFKQIDYRSHFPRDPEIGRASGRERGCQYVYISGVDVPLKKKNKKTNKK